MKRFLAALLLLVATPALAADEVWTLTETKSVRFSDRDVAGPTFPAGARLEVLVREGDRLRVQAGDEMGWIGKASVTDVAPPEASDFDTEAMRRQLEAMGAGLPTGGPPGGAVPAPSGVPRVPSPVPAPGK